MPPPQTIKSPHNVKQNYTDLQRQKMSEINNAIHIFLTCYISELMIIKKYCVFKKNRRNFKTALILLLLLLLLLSNYIKE